MDANQEQLSNPFGMDETCENCPELCETRRQVVHGYGDVGAEFIFVGEMPDGDGADQTGVPFIGNESGRRLLSILVDLGFSDSEPDADEPDVDNVFLTYLTRCHHPERPPTDGEIMNCEPFLNAEIRMINPEIIVPVGERALAELTAEYTTKPADSFDIVDDHATEIRGRGFELVPMIDPTEQSDEQREAFLKGFSKLLGRDYRQTKGRQARRDN